MEVKIGVQHAPRELVLETNETPRGRREAGGRRRQRTACSRSPTTKGRRILVPGDKIAYVEIGGGVAGQVGFRS